MRKLIYWISNLSMTVKYIIALVLIITPIILGGVFTQSKNDDMEYYGVAYNVVLTQRMRVFLISNYAQLMFEGYEENDSEKYMNADAILAQQIVVFEEQADALLNGSDELGIPKPTNDDFILLLNEIKELADEYIIHVENLQVDMTSEEDLNYITSHTLELNQKLYELDVLLEDTYLEGYNQLSSVNFVIVMITVLIVFFALMQIRLVRRIEYQAKFDKLTDLRNRSYLFDHIKTLNPKEYGVIFIDLHHFKNFNNTYGNKLGDQILIEFANRLRNQFKTSEIYRYGGDEFVILVNEKENNIVDKTLFLEELKYMLLEPIHDEKNRYHSINVTIGCAGALIDIDSFEEKIKLAEDLRYDSRNYRLQPMLCCNIEDTRRRLLLTNSIEKAITENQIMVYFHPLHFVDGSIKGFEALTRWKLNDEVIPPGVFIPLINSSGLGYQLDLKMIELVGKSYQKLANAKAGFNPYVSINIAIDTITHIASDTIIDLLQKSGMPKQKVILEILEDVVISPQTRKKLKHLKDAGYTVALDDFTTGATSFDYLTLEEFSLVKIDQGVIKQLAKYPSRIDVLKDLVKMIHTSNKEVLIEGIETQAEIDIVHDLGVDAIQGYYYSKPLPLAEAVEYIKNYVLKEE